MHLISCETRQTRTVCIFALGGLIMLMLIILAVQFPKWRGTTSPPQDRPDSPLSPKAALRLIKEEFAGDVVRFKCYLVNDSNSSICFASKPLDSRNVPSILKNKQSNRIVLMVSVMRDSNDLENEVYRDSDLGRVMLESGSVFELFSVDLPRDEVVGQTVVAAYVAFPDTRYRDYWSGELQCQVAFSDIK